MPSHARKPILTVQPVVSGGGGGGITTVTGSGTFTTPGDTVTIDATGMSTAIVQLGPGGGFNGFLAHLEGSIDGVNFYTIPGYRLVSGNVVSTTPTFSMGLPTRTYFVNVAGYSTFRVYLDALISGSPVALIVATEASVDPRAMDVASEASLQALLAWYDGTNGPIQVSLSGAGTQPVSVADGADVAQGTTTNAAITSDTNGTVIGFLRGLVKMVASAWDNVNGRLKVDGSGVTQPVSNAALTSIDGKTPSLGQQLAAASSPVVLTAAQITTLTPPAAIAGYALEAGHLATIDSHIPALGQALAAASVPVVLPVAQITTLTPPAAITGFALDATLTSRAQKTQITDGTRDATVKAASTPSTTLDTALVVSVRDPLPIGTNVIGHVIADSLLWSVATENTNGTGWNNATALNTTLGLNTTGYATAVINLAGGVSGATGQVTFEGSDDGGTHWQVLPVTYLDQVPNQWLVTSLIDLTTSIPQGVIYANIAGMTNIRLRLSQVLGNATLQIFRIGATSSPMLAMPLLTSLSFINGVKVNVGAGAAGTGTQRVTLADSGTGTVEPWDGTNRITVKAASTASVATDTAQVVALSPNSPAPLPTLTKGTQGATGVSVQRLNDAGRNTRIFMLDAITAAPVAEALQTVVQWYGNAAVAGTTTPAVVPAGKTLRLTGYKIMYQSLATVGYAVVRIRVNTGGVAALASPLVASFEAGSGSGSTTVAMTGGVTTETGSFPEGLEIPAGAGIGFSMAGYGPTGTLTLEGGVRFEVHGYEY